MTPLRPASVVTLGLLCLGGCFGSPAKEEFFYFLSGPTGLIDKGTGPRLAVADFVVAPGYDTAKLAYRTNANELRYYQSRQWISEPGRMITDLVIRHLRATRRFAEVGPAEKVRDPQALLDGTVEALEEVDHETSWYGRLAMTLRLRGEEKEQVLLRHAFDQQRRCVRRHPVEVARTASEILEEELRRLAPRLAHAVH
ncbi:MAG: membrane integrity-associated transporter subunit PqiC [Deltaproteobacteria bacterium]|nr:membrane integrity-associated transporter subunit PqiC [Deltaproteobacteria bacterium]